MAKIDAHLLTDTMGDGFGGGDNAVAFFDQVFDAKLAVLFLELVLDKMLLCLDLIMKSLRLLLKQNELLDLSLKVDSIVSAHISSVGVFIGLDVSVFSLVKSNYRRTRVRDEAYKTFWSVGPHDCGKSFRRTKALIYGSDLKVNVLRGIVLPVDKECWR